MTAPRPLIDYGRMLDVVGIEGELMLSAAASALPSSAQAEVPGCPDLTLAETLRHVGGVHRETRQWVRDGHRPEQWQRSPSDADLLGVVRTGLRELLTELGMHDPAEPCDTWWPDDRTHGFWRRRMAHETTVHRVDVEAAAGGPVHPVDSDVALDGIDELLFLWFGHRLGELGISSPQRGVVALSAADRRWLAIFEPGRSTARRVDEADARAADAMVSGEPMEVYLWSWGRLPDQSVRISGDQEAVGLLWTLLRPATQ
ncbi:MAG: maleylpyruvate isomerase family mycothiol-dependent enzyme [Pseudonocardiales bacterium]|nr:maleylpyruvate isomerase family mycothiol-dependent enzyme [Pseudonocardiales bacterium]MBV9029199.1 maleylpyruvate isomerase family mycothiol-dependent enzyme [Pseudonocardiales bacterium]MBW0010450.1 maleylpyruvate isomerase family mycothiol-dependent enzyme [Pseudonocardiales bacterium]